MEVDEGDGYLCQDLLSWSEIRCGNSMLEILSISFVKLLKRMDKVEEHCNVFGLQFPSYLHRMVFGTVCGKI